MVVATKYYSFEALDPLERSALKHCKACLQHTTLREGLSRLLYLDPNLRIAMAPNP